MAPENTNQKEIRYILLYSAPARPYWRW